MKKLICLTLALAFCVFLACPAFAAEADEGFVASPGTEPTECNHSGEIEIVGKKDPTCTSEGYTGDKICKDCGKVLEYGQVIPKAEHSFADGVCTVCGLDENNPETGDNSMIPVWMAVMGVAVVGLVAVTAIYRKESAKH